MNSNKETLSENAQSSLTIIYAAYGYQTRVNDVTQNVQHVYSMGTRTFQATNDWGGDPYPGAEKSLFIVWQQAGVISSGVCSEDHDPLQLP